jgi:hypothetical protein
MGKRKGKRTQFPLQAIRVRELPSFLLEAPTAAPPTSALRSYFALLISPTMSTPPFPRLLRRFGLSSRLKAAQVGPSLGISAPASETPHPLLRLPLVLVLYLCLLLLHFPPPVPFFLLHCFLLTLLVDRRCPHSARGSKGVPPGGCSLGAGAQRASRRGVGAGG